MLLVRNLNVWKDNAQLLYDIYLYTFKTAVIFGPNGAGKSTLLKVIMGVGSFKVKGFIGLNRVDISNKSIYERAKLGLFLAYQNPPFIKGLSLFSLFKHKNPIETHKILKDLLDQLDLDESFLHRDFSTLSGGERKKMELVQMLYLKPKFVLLDEIENGLDVKTRKWLIDWINTSPVEKLIVSHNNDFIKSIEYDGGLFFMNKGHF